MKEYTLFKSLRSQLGLISNSKLFLLVEFCPAPYVSLTNFFFLSVKVVCLFCINNCTKKKEQYTTRACLTQQNKNK